MSKDDQKVVNYIKKLTEMLKLEHVRSYSSTFLNLKINEFDTLWIEFESFMETKKISWFKKEHNVKRIITEINDWRHSPNPSRKYTFKSYHLEKFRKYPEFLEFEKRVFEIYETYVNENDSPNVILEDAIDFLEGN